LRWYCTQNSQLLQPTPTAALQTWFRFSGAYTDLVGTNWNPNWGQSTVYSEVLISENATKKYSNFNYQGIDCKVLVDASMAKLHLMYGSIVLLFWKCFGSYYGSEKYESYLYQVESFDIALDYKLNLDLKV
jgi:hypothetical protein